MNLAVLQSWPLFFGILMLTMGNGLQGTLLGLRAGLEGYTPFSIGLIMSCYYLGYLIGSTFAPKLVQNVGHIRVFAALASLASACVLGHEIFNSQIAWSIIRIATGFAYVGLFVVVESWLNGISTSKNRGSVISLYMLTNYLGMVIGQFLLNTADPASATLFIAVSILVSLALVPLSLLRQPAPDFESPDPIKMSHLFKTSPLGTIGVFLYGIQSSLIFGMGAVYTSMVGMNTKETSLFMAAVIIGGVIAQYPAGMLSDRFGRRGVIIWCSLFALLTSIIATLVPYQFTSQIILVFLIGAFAFPTYALLIAYTHDRLRTSEMTAASSRLILVNGMGAIVGPVLVSVLMHFFGGSGFYISLLLVYISLMGIGIYRAHVTDALPVDEQGDLVYMPTRSTPVLGEMIDADSAENAEQENPA